MTKRRSRITTNPKHMPRTDSEGADVGAEWRHTGAYYDNEGNVRVDGFLHPKSYLWVINEAFDGGNREVPERLLSLYEGAIEAWDWKPHLHRLQRWEAKRFDKLLRTLLGDAWKGPEDQGGLTG